MHGSPRPGVRDAQPVRAPWHLGMSRSQLVREASASLADDLQVVNDPHLHERIRVEGLAVELGLLLNTVDRFEDVLEAIEVAPHSGTASDSTRSRTRGRSPCSVATSTLPPRTV